MYRIEATKTFIGGLYDGLSVCWGYDIPTLEIAQSRLEEIRNMTTPGKDLTGNKYRLDNPRIETV